MKELQEEVLKFTQKYNLNGSPEIRYIDLTSEVGELGKELLIGSDYGGKKFEKTSNIDSELGDTLFSLICLSNELNVDLDSAIEKVITKYENRFDKAGTVGSEAE